MSTKKISKNTSKKQKVFVGLSGGVDSAVSAALLKEQGYDVTGVFIKVWSPDFLPCTWRDERRDAMRVAAHLDIPFLFFDFEKEYKEGVADYMISEYRLGRTPNPDVMCNREIKFGALWQKAKSLGADFIATGHYAQNLHIQGPTLDKTGDNFSLQEGKDREKDQSYFLWTLTQEDLIHTLFPIGHLEKKEVRKLAEKFNLPVSEKKDSQGICFLGDVDIEEFLSHFIKTEKGNVLDIEGNIIGTHNGAIFYTLGERHGFDIRKKKPDDGAFYVVSKDVRENTITVSSNKSVISSFSTKKVKLSNINWINKPKNNLSGRVRYKQTKFSIEIKGEEVTFKETQTVDIGQSLVFYDGEECLGGGVIEEVIEN